MNFLTNLKWPHKLTCKTFIFWYFEFVRIQVESWEPPLERKVKSRWNWWPITDNNFVQRSGNSSAHRFSFRATSVNLPKEKNLLKTEFALDFLAEHQAGNSSSWMETAILISRERAGSNELRLFRTSLTTYAQGRRVTSWRVNRDAAAISRLPRQRFGCSY